MNFLKKKVFPVNISQVSDLQDSCNVRGVFLDKSKAFDRVWHDGLIFKMH